MQYRFNAIKSLPVKLKFDADFYNLVDKQLIGLNISDRNGNQLYWLTDVYAQDGKWYCDWVIPEDMNKGLYDLEWTYKNEEFGNLQTAINTLSVHEPLTSVDLSLIEKIYIKASPFEIIPNYTKYIDILVECPQLPVIPNLHARILDYFNADIIQDWTELECVDYKKFRINISETEFEHKQYQLDTKMVVNNLEFLSDPYMLSISNRRTGIDKIL